MLVDGSRLDVANRHEANATDVEMLVDRDHQRLCRCLCKFLGQVVHQGVEPFPQMRAVLGLKGPPAKACLLEEALDLVLVNPPSVLWSNDGEAPLNSRAGEGDERFTKRGVDGFHLDQANTCSGQGVEEGPKAFRVLRGPNDRQDPCAAVA